MRTYGLKAAALCACLALAACGKKDNAADTTAAARTDSAAAAPAPAANAPLNDANIMAAISMANDEEIADARLADSMAANANVKAFARDMVKDHSAMKSDGDKLASKEHITPAPPPNADAERQRGESEMSQMRGAGKGAAFDKAYIDDQVADHQAALDKLNQFQAQAQDTALKAMITKALPKVQQHLQRAKDIQGKLGSAPAAAPKTD